MSNKFDKFYMSVAEQSAHLSYCERRKVGAVIVSAEKGIYHGFNGTPSGFPNVCELADGTTNPLTIHAEENALLKMLRSGVSSKDSICYVTCSPCPTCAKMLYSAGVKEVVYKEEYHSVEHLKQFVEYGMRVRRFNHES